MDKTLTEELGVTPHSSYAIDQRSTAGNIIANIRLCNVPITPTNQLLFKNATDQLNYFLDHTTRTITGCRYIARTGTIKVSGYVDAIASSNYGFYETGYNGQTRRYFFWIVRKDYMAKEVTKLTIQLDAIQTWMFIAKHNPCFVERMHVDDDTPGKHTYPEDFELGEYVCYHKRAIEEMKNAQMCFIMGNSLMSSGSTYNNVFSGYDLLYFSSESSLSSYITDLTKQGKADAISFIFTFPMDIVTKYYGVPKGANKYVIPSTTVLSVTKDFQDIRASEFYDKDVEGVTGYRPDNAKLLCYPFKFIQVSAPDGNTVMLKHELFKKRNAIFELSWTMGQNPTFSLTPIDYSGKDVSYEDSIECGGWPLCSWNNDNYANWYAQNSYGLKAQAYTNHLSYKTNTAIAQNNYGNAKDNANTQAAMSAVNIAADAVGSVTNLFSGNIAGAINGVAGGVAAGVNAYMQHGQSGRNASNDLNNANLLNDTNYQSAVALLNASIYDAQVKPNTCKGDTTASGLDAMRGTNTFYVEFYNIRVEYAKIIDEYFTMYGYKVMQLVKNPTDYINTRQNFNYIKTVNDTCYGDLPQEDRDEVSRLFNNGITFWHSPSTFMDYTADNNIVKKVNNGRVSDGNNLGTGSGSIVDPNG